MVTKKFDATFIWILLVFVLCGFCWIWGYGAGTTHPDIVYQDSIIVKDSIIIDSIFVENDSIETKIVYIKNDYNEKVNTIVSNTDSANYLFFTNYIYNYSRSTEGN